MNRNLMVMVLGLTLGATGCDSAADAEPASGPPVVAPGALEVVEPGGETRCSRDTPFRFAVIGGDPDKIVIDFAGGGACWNEFTCAASSQLFSEAAPSAEQFAGWLQDGTAGGLYTDAADNPLAGWTVVHIPYCTGDIHWGDTVTDYGPDNRVHHVGQRNVKAVMDWIFARYDSPDEILVSGCSAGAYGAIAYASTVADHYRDAEMTVLADSGAGVLSDSFLPESFPNWNALAALPDLPGISGREVTDMAIADLYIAVGAAHPAMRIAQYNTAFDVRQSFYYQAMGGGGDWTDAMLESQSSIAGATPNYSYYVAPGQTHCILPYQHFFTRESGPQQTRFAGWLGQLIGADELPQPVVCEAGQCFDDPVCEACLSGTSDAPECGFCEGWDGAPN